MFLLNGLKKILVLPIVLVLGLLWLVVKILVSLYEVAHGIVFALVILFCIAAIVAYGDWVQAGLYAGLGLTSFLVLFASTFFEVLLETQIKMIWNL